MKIDLKGISETALLPLYARTLHDDILQDDMAKELVKKIDYDFEALKTKAHDSDLFCIARDVHFDYEIKKFLEANPYGCIVDLGCGLNTSFYRNDNGKCLWIDIDLPEMLNLKNELFCKLSARFNYFGGNIININWDDLKTFNTLLNFGVLNLIRNNNSSDQILFLAGGLFPYFKEEEVKKIITEMASRFPGMSLIFDCIPNSIIPLLNDGLKENNLSDFTLQWGLDNAKDLESWSDNIEVIYQFPYFYRLYNTKSICHDKIEKIDRYRVLNKSSFVRLKFIGNSNE